MAYRIPSLLIVARHGIAHAGTAAVQAAEERPSVVAVAVAVAAAGARQSGILHMTAEVAGSESATVIVTGTGAKIGAERGIVAETDLGKEMASTETGQGTGIGIVTGIGIGGEAEAGAGIVLTAGTSTRALGDDFRLFVGGCEPGILILNFCM